MANRVRGKQSVQKLLGGADTPLFLLTAQRKILFFNAGCERLTGWSASEVEGLVSDYASGGESSGVDALVSALCPPPEVFSGEHAAAPVFIPQRDGEPLPRLIHYFPLAQDDRAAESILGVITLIPSLPHAAETTPSRRLHAELSAVRMALRQRFEINSLVCRSSAMIRVLEQISLARSARTAVLLQGETGTGKEHIARTIHYESESRHRSFMPLDCRRLSALELKQALKRFLDSGRIEDDSGFHGTGGPAALKPGTVFLSHVEQLPRDLQEMLLMSFGPENPQRRTDLRLMGSTSIDLRSVLRSEALRPDFYYLLTALSIDLPPLRERMEDLSLLAQELLEELNRGEERQIGGFADDVWEKFREYNWPGNLDELRAVVSESRAACAESMIRIKDLPFRFRTGLEAQSVGPPRAPRVVPLEPLLARVEKEQIELALSQTRQNKSKAAELLGLTRPRLYRRMEALGIEDQEETTG